MISMFSERMERYPDAVEASNAEENLRQRLRRLIAAFNGPLGKIFADLIVQTRFPEVKTIELNALPYALAFYRSIGFVPISREFESKGFRATRMACWLAAQTLCAEL